VRQSRLRVGRVLGQHTTQQIEYVADARMTEVVLALQLEQRVDELLESLRGFVGSRRTP